jgi:hypothetical protein
MDSIRSRALVRASASGSSAVEGLSPIRLLHSASASYGAARDP